MTGRQEIIAHQKTNYMTQRTLDRLNEELARVRQEAAEAERGLGETFDSPQDWHDNAAYDEKRRQVQLLNTRVLELQNKLTNITLIKPRTNIDTIDIGNTIEVLYEGETEPETYTILGKDDTHTQKDWISYETPLAKSLIGVRVDSQVEITLPDNQKARVKVVGIFPGRF